MSVVIFAQIGYAVAFVVKFADYYDSKKKSGHFSRCELFGWFCVGLLFSPIMSFIFYWTSDPDMCLAQIFKHRFKLYIEDKKSDRYVYRYSWVKEEDKKKTEKSQIKEWIEAKMRKHFGFILEAGIDDAINRAFAYVEAGADGIMIHSRKKTADEIFIFSKIILAKM